MIRVSTDAIEFATNEILVVHALCDLAEIPREIDEELLSMSQRVAVLQECFAQLASRVGMEPPHTIH